MNICTYWEGPVSWLERVCIRSMLDVGHRVEVFTNDVAKLKKTGLHDQITDVREVLDPNHPGYLYKEQQGGLRVFSDIARLAMLQQGRGVWADADCLFLRPLMNGREIVFGRVSRKRIANGVLLLPRDSSILLEYYGALSAVPFRAQWVNLRLRLLREIEIALGGKVPRHAGRGSIGPRALTYFVKRAGLEPEALPVDVFYPVPLDRAQDLVAKDATAVSELRTPATRVIHTWQSTLMSLGLLDARPPASSYLGQACRRLDV